MIPVSVQIINSLITLGMIIGIPLFMFTVIKSLNRIEVRLDNLEKTISHFNDQNND